MRAFFCFPVTQGVRAEADLVSEAIRQRLGPSTRASWVRAANYHVTARFLGEIDPMSTVALQREAQQAVRDIRPFDITFERLGCFPAIERPRVLWLGGAAPHPLQTLLDRLNQGLQAIGFPAERSDDLAHLTLARFKSVRSEEVNSAIRAVHAPSVSCPIRQLVLMESRLTPRGAVYSPLFEVCFASPGGNHAV